MFRSGAFDPSPYSSAQAEQWTEPENRSSFIEFP